MKSDIDVRGGGESRERAMVSGDSGQGYGRGNGPRDVLRITIAGVRWGAGTNGLRRWGREPRRVRQFGPAPEERDSRSFMQFRVTSTSERSQRKWTGQSEKKVKRAPKGSRPSFVHFYLDVLARAGPSRGGRTGRVISTRPRRRFERTAGDRSPGRKTAPCLSQERRNRPSCVAQLSVFANVPVF